MFCVRFVNIFLLIFSFVIVFSFLPCSAIDLNLDNMILNNLNSDNLSSKESGLIDLHARKKLAYDFKLYDINENIIEIEIEDYKNKLKILYFWAAWNTDCIIGMKDLLLLADYLRKNEVNNFAIMPILSQSLGAEEIKKFYKDNNLEKLPIFVDLHDDNSSQLGVLSLPTTFFLDKNNKIAFVKKGVINYYSSNIQKILFDLSLE